MSSPVIQGHPPPMSKGSQLLHITEDARCRVHLESLQLFCDDEQVTLCRKCVQSSEHKHHMIYEVQEAAENYRKLFHELLDLLKEKLEAVKSLLAEEQDRMVLAQEEEQNFKEMVESEYNMRFRLLQEVNEPNALSLQGCGFNLGESNHNRQQNRLSTKLAKSQEMLQRISCLGRENRNKLEASVVQVSEQMHQLQSITRELEKTCGESALALLQNARYLLERSESALHQCLEPASLTDLSSCHGQEMSQMVMLFQRHITLDPGTAHPCLVLSHNLRRMTFGNRPQDVPGAPGTFDFGATVLGAESFSSGRHYWEVAVGKATKWQLGICDCADRTTNIPKAPGNKILLMGAMMETDYTYWVFPPLRKLGLKQQMVKIGIFLDYDYGQISFYNVTESSLIYNFSSLTFHGAIRPIFSLCISNGHANSDSLSICPLQVPA